MKKRVTIAACIAGLLVPAMVWANYRKDYCDGKEYVGNAGNKYPHLHCGSGFFTFSETGSKHKNMHEGQGKNGAGCKRARDVLADPPYNAENTKDPDAITTAIQAFIDAECQ